VQAVIIARFLRSTDLVLQPQNHGGRISDGESLHSIKTHPLLCATNYDAAFAALRWMENEGDIESGANYFGVSRACSTGAWTRLAFYAN